MAGNGDCGQGSGTIYTESGATKVHHLWVGDLPRKNPPAAKNLGRTQLVSGNPLNSQRVLEQQLEERSPWSLARGARKALEGKKARGGFGDRHGLNREGLARLYGETAQMESPG